jgi:hypothetical protein
MFQALLAHPQEVSTNGTWYIACVLCQLAVPRAQTALGILRAFVSWLCHRCSETAIVAQPTDSIRTQYTKCRLCSASLWWTSNARIVQRPFILNKLNKKCITLVSLYWYTVMHGHYTDILWCTVNKTLSLADKCWLRSVPVFASAAVKHFTWSDGINELWCNKY